MLECANYIAGLPGVTDVSYDGGEVIQVCGSIAADELQALVLQWWKAAPAQGDSLHSISCAPGGPIDWPPCAGSQPTSPSARIGRKTTS